jgi:NAD(P)H-dependent FMN reductase
MGNLGGTRMIEQLRLVSIELHMKPTREAVYFSSVKTLFDKNENIKNPSYSEKISTILKELEMLAEKLK